MFVVVVIVVVALGLFTLKTVCETCNMAVSNNRVHIKCSC